MIFHIFSIPFLPRVFHRRLFKVLRKKNEIHCRTPIRDNTRFERHKRTQFFLVIETGTVVDAQFFSGFLSGFH